MALWTKTFRVWCQLWPLINYSKWLGTDFTVCSWNCFRCRLIWDKSGTGSDVFWCREKKLGNTSGFCFEVSLSWHKHTQTHTCAWVPGLSDISFVWLRPEQINCSIVSLFQYSRSGVLHDAAKQPLFCSEHKSCEQKEQFHLFSESWHNTRSVKKAQFTCCTTGTLADYGD